MLQYVENKATFKVLIRCDLKLIEKLELDEMAKEQFELVEKLVIKTKESLRGQ